MKTLISIAGATGIGKTRLAIDLAKYYGTEIISCDSRQFFREMKIGTAAPSEAELAAAKHHFIGNLGVEDQYSIGQYEVDSLKKTEEIFNNNDVAILAGGSMMYEKALVEGLNDLPEAHEDHQKKLVEIWQKDGLGALQHILQKHDPEYFEMVDQENPRRLLRAIDVIWQTGKKYSDITREPKKSRNFRTVRIGIAAAREIIYEKINSRLDEMMENGLLEEVKALKNSHRENYRSLVPLKTVGYTEIFNYLDGIWDLDFAVAEIKKNSRRFAKRQLTWYRGEENIHWVNYENAFHESLSLLEDLEIGRCRDLEI